jgi:hypothetical protein
MSRLEYTVEAAPELVLESIAAASARPTVIGFALTDRTRSELVGDVSKEHRSFDLRRSRRLGTPPRVAMLRGRVEATGMGAKVVATYALHPAVRIARLMFVLLFVAFALLVLPAASSQPQLLWIPVVIGFIVLLMMVPFEWLAFVDRSRLRLALEDALRRAGPLKIG